MALRKLHFHTDCSHTSHLVHISQVIFSLVIKINRLFNLVSTMFALEIFPNASLVNHLDILEQQWFVRNFLITFASHKTRIMLNRSDFFTDVLSYIHNEPNLVITTSTFEIFLLYNLNCD